jgi:hypothetical protein
MIALAIKAAPIETYHRIVVLPAEHFPAKQNLSMAQAESG